MRSGLVVRNVATTLAAQVISWGITFVVLIFVPRYVGSKGLGELGLMASFGAFGVLGTSLGTSNVLTRDIARDHSAVGRLLSTAIVSRAIMGVVTFVVGLVAVNFLHYNKEATELILIGLSLLVVGQLSDASQASLRGLEEIPHQNFAVLCESLINAILQISVVLLRLPIWLFALLPLAGMLTSLTICQKYLHKHSFRFSMPSRDDIFWLLRSAMPFLSVAVFLAIYSQSDAILIKQFSNYESVGYYNLSRRLIGSTLVIPGAVMGAMLPTLSRLSREDPQLFIRLVSRTMNIMVVCVVPIAAVLLIAPISIIKLMHFPGDFKAAAPVMSVMTFATILWYISAVAGNALIASDRQIELSKSTSLGALICIPTSCICIYFANKYLDNGAIGAALSNAITESVILGGYLRALPSGMVGAHTVKSVGKAILSVLPLGAWLYFAEPQFKLIGAIPLGIFYGILCLIIGAIDRQDIDMMSSIATKKFGK